MSLKQRAVNLAEEDLLWYENTYPNGTLSWLMGLLLKKFREAHATTPAIYAEVGAAALLDQLNDEMPT